MLSVWAAVANPLERVSQTHPEVVALNTGGRNYLRDQLLQNRGLWNTKRVQKTSSSVKIGIVCCALCMRQNEIIVTAW